MASQAQLDAAAQQMGFRDYATYQAYQAQQSARIHARSAAGTGNNGVVQQAPQAVRPPPKNWLQYLLNALNGKP